jgi:hypothetical protein
LCRRARVVGEIAPPLEPGRHGRQNEKLVGEGSVTGPSRTLAERFEELLRLTIRLTVHSARRLAHQAHLLLDFLERANVLVWHWPGGGLS